jgi:hypothetical protein
VVAAEHDNVVFSHVEVRVCRVAQVCVTGSEDMNWSQRIGNGSKVERKENAPR